MKHIVFDCERMKYSNTGLEQYCLNLGFYLNKNSNRNSEEITYYSPSKSLKIWSNQRIIKQKSVHKLVLPNLNKYTIWHSTYQGSDYIPIRNKQIKKIVTIHDLNFIHEDKSDRKKLRNLSHLQKNINTSDAIICISDFCKQDVIHHCDTGNKPIYMIHNGTNSLLHPELKYESYKPKRPFLFSLGSICKKKNFHVLLPLLKYNKHLELIIAGGTSDPSYLKYLYAQAKKLCVEESLRIIGTISEHEKSWYYQNCYAFAFPSIAEGFGLPVAEAMSVGKPVFLSDKTSLPEIGKTEAFYFSDFSENHMQDVFATGMKKYQQQNMQPAIEERGRSFCWDRSAKAYLDVYRSLY